jgi:phosphatidate cytidylyltransferase
MTAARIATAAILIPVVVAVVWWGSTGLVAALVALITLLALLEFFSLGARINLHAYRFWTCLCAVAIVFQQWAPDSTNLYVMSIALSIPILLLFVFGIAASVLTSQRPVTGALGDLSLSAAGLLFIAMPLSTLVRLHQAGGPRLLLFALVLVWVGDTAAYFVGRAIGRHHMAPHLSPGKTWEGAVGNLMGSVAVGVAFARWMQFDVANMAAMAAFASIAGQAGDLLESAYKRSAGAKDSGALLPGHGGVLDRIDALIFAAPVVWYYFNWVLARHTYI